MVWDKFRLRRQSKKVCYDRLRNTGEKFISAGGPVSYTRFFRCSPTRKYIKTVGSRNRKEHRTELQEQCFSGRSSFSKTEKLAAVLRGARFRSAPSPYWGIKFLLSGSFSSFLNGKTIYQYYEQTINKIRISIKMIQIQNNGCRDSGKKWTLLGLEEGRTITPHFPSASEVRGKWQRMPNWSLYSKATRQQKGKRRPRDPWYTATGKMES